MSNERKLNMSEEYEIIFITEEGRAIKNNKTGKIYHSEFEIIDEKNKQIKDLQQKVEQLEKENKQLKDNWIMLKEHLTNRYNNGTESISYRQVFIEIREAMQVLEIQQELEQRRQELEKGDSNE